MSTLMRGEYYIYIDEHGTANLRFMGAATTGEQLRAIVSSITEKWAELEIHARMGDAIVGNLIGHGNLHEEFFFQEHGACRGLMITLRDLFSEVEDVLDMRNHEKYRSVPEK